MLELQKKLNKIQQELKAPKNQNNTFGKYNYRSCEDILEAVKPLLGEATLTISDKIINLADRFYVKATARLTEKKESFEVHAYAREPEIQKGMNEAQITGSASSYARKYSLNGLFAIDDTKDADTQDNAKPAPKVIALASVKQKELINQGIADLHLEAKEQAAMIKFGGATSIETLTYAGATKILKAIKTKINNKLTK